MPDPITLALIAVVMVLGGIVKGTLGLGLPLVCVGFMSIFLPVKMLLGIAILPILVTNLFQVFESGGGTGVLRTWWPMILCFWAGLLAGSHLLVTLQPESLYAVIGTVLIVFCLSGFFRPNYVLPEKYVLPISLFAGSFAGFSGGLSSVWGPPVTMFMMLTGMKKEVFVRTAGVIWCCGAIPLGLIYAHNGVIGPHNAFYSMISCFPAMAGLWVGQRIRKRIPQDVFRKILMAVLFVIGINLVRRAFFV